VKRPVPAGTWGLLCWLGALLLIGWLALVPRPPLPPMAGAATLAVVDLSQSMNVTDQYEDGRPVSRLAFVRDALAALVADLPCGAALGLGMFVEHRTLLLFSPVEVCDNRGELLRAIASLDTRSAWNGNSEIAKGYNAAWQLAAARPERPALVFITDGHEAPPVNPRHRPAFSGQAGTLRVLIAGVGGDQPMPIPRHDPEGRPLGFWGADEVMQVDPYSIPRTATADDRLIESEPLRDGDDRAAGTPGSEHLSQLREDYLRLIAGETGARFTRLRTVADLAEAVAALHGIGLRQAPRASRTALILAALGLVMAGLVAGWWPRDRGHHRRRVGARAAAVNRAQESTQSIARDRTEDEAAAA
jgi:mxaL protein